MKGLHILVDKMKVFESCWLSLFVFFQAASNTTALAMQLEGNVMIEIVQHSTCTVSIFASLQKPDEHFYIMDLRSSTVHKLLEIS